eukprot:TRINITY_DN16044_c0_g1_i1.p1 TRINITY_DN16044_c0_g1~~TRINITY_DN16044_c0_g1_i1.p1  ORF type:complete len:162 (-),score=42.12 TRINITY_DN16044_c0_g1_i1:48-533(-)
MIANACIVTSFDGEDAFLCQVLRVECCLELSYVFIAESGLQELENSIQNFLQRAIVMHLHSILLMRTGHVKRSLRAASLALKSLDYHKKCTTYKERSSTSEWEYIKIKTRCFERFGQALMLNHAYSNAKQQFELLLNHARKHDMLAAELRGLLGIGQAVVS